MLFNKNKAKTAAIPLLKKDNVIINCQATNKNDAIRKVGQLLVDSGYVNDSYIEGMIAREDTFATYMGNFLALPHGVEAVKDDIISSGIAVMIFPEGVDWNGNLAKIVIGIAGKGGEHIEILSNIATKLIDVEVCEEIIASQPEVIYDILTSEVAS